MTRTLFLLLLISGCAMAQYFPPSQGQPPGGPAGGGLTGNYPSPTLARPNAANGPVVLDGSGNANLPGNLTIGDTLLGGSVWTRRGLAVGLPAGAGEPTPLYSSTGCQILASPCFRIWYTGTGGIEYAESLDGLTGWTLHSGAVLAGYARSFVVHSGSTYYLYAVPMPTANSIDVFTSPDGITFTLAKTGAITLGAGGTWDSTVLANMSVIVDGATWRMAYEALKTGSDWQIGIAISADGLTWTKYGSNPVMGVQGVMSAGGPSLWRDPATGIYWCWAHVAYPGLGVGDLPTDGARFKSTNWTTWTMDPETITLPRLTYDEGARDLGGEIADPALIEVNGVVYEYYSGIRNQTVGGSIKVATVPMTLHQLVATDEGATVLYTGLNLQPGNANNPVVAGAVQGNAGLITPGCMPYILTAGKLDQKCNFVHNQAHDVWEFSTGVTTDYTAFLNVRAGQNTLVNGSSFTPAVGMITSAGIYTGLWWPGQYVGDTYVGKDATTDDFIIYSVDKATPTQMLRVTQAGIVSVGAGTNILYRCTVAGTLRVGQTTTVSADCGTAVDTGMRVQ